MATYTGRQSLLDASLGEYNEQGFTILETDDHVTELYHNGHFVARFNRTKATIQAIRDACAEHLKAEGA